MSQDLFEDSIFMQFAVDDEPYGIYMDIEQFPSIQDYTDLQPPADMFPICDPRIATPLPEQFYRDVDIASIDSLPAFPSIDFPIPPVDTIAHGIPSTPTADFSEPAYGSPCTGDEISSYSSPFPATPSEYSMGSFMMQQDFAELELWTSMLSLDSAAVSPDSIPSELDGNVSSAAFANPAYAAGITLQTSISITDYYPQRQGDVTAKHTTSDLSTLVHPSPNTEIHIDDEVQAIVVRKGSPQSVRKPRAPRSNAKASVIGSRKTKIFQCTVCTQICSRKYNLKAHMATHDSTRLKPFVCPYEICDGGVCSDETFSFNTVAVTSGLDGCNYATLTSVDMQKRYGTRIINRLTRHSEQYFISCRRG
ncbi:hypothetical protein ABKN59_005188 [Abortiporus biennis]